MTEFSLRCSGGVEAHGSRVKPVHTPEEQKGGLKPFSEGLRFRPTWGDALSPSGRASGEAADGKKNNPKQN